MSEITRGSKNFAVDARWMRRTSQLVNWRAPAILWITLLSMLVVDAVWVFSSSMTVDYQSVKSTVVFPFLFGTIAFVYIFPRPAPRLALTTLAIAQISLFAAPVYVLSNLVISLDRPFIDDTLAHIDEWLGFDWVSYAKFISGNQFLHVTLAWLYTTPAIQALVLVTFFGFMGKFDNLHRLIANMTFSLIIVLAIAAVFPAVSAYYHYGTPDLGISKYAGAVRAVHDGTIKTISFDKMEGLIDFPSYHTALSIAFVISSWPVRYLRYPILFLNIALIAGVPVYGEHYLVDIIAGAAIAYGVDLLWRRMERHWAHTRELTAQ